jgi:hypothetical protein
MADEEQKKPKKSDDEIAGKAYDSQLMRRLGHYLRPYWWQASVSAIAVSLKSLCDVSGPYLIMVGIDLFQPPRSLPRLHQLAHQTPPHRSQSGHHPPGNHLPGPAPLRLSL